MDKEEQLKWNIEKFPDHDDKENWLSELLTLQRKKKSDNTL